MADALSRLGSPFVAGRTVYAAKVAVAAGIAWLIVAPWGGVADAYPYYAPLGAVVVVADTVTGSVRNGLSSIGSILVGAVLAVGALYLPMPDVLAVTAVVLLGSWLAYGGRLGPLSSWAPISGIFVLIVGGEEPVTFMIAYAGLVGVGAVVGLAVELVWPALPLDSAESALDCLQQALVDHLEDLVEGLGAERIPTTTDWRDRHRGLDARAADMDRLVADALKARRGNWRAGRWRVRGDAQRRRARALAQLTFLVQETFDLVTLGERAESAEPAWGSELRAGVAAAIRATADMLAVTDDDKVPRPAWERACRDTETVAACIRRHRLSSDAEFFTAGSVVTTLRRVLRSVEPDDAG